MGSGLDDSGTEVLAETEREVLGWLEFGEASRHLAGDVLESGFEPDLVVAIARGGLLLAGAISYALGIKACGALNVEFYTGVDERLPMPVMLPPVPQPVDLSGATVLIIDDVADTGGTLDLVRKFCEGHVKETRCAVIYEKSRSMVKCEYVWKRTDQWIDFPWSSQPEIG